MRKRTIWMTAVLVLLFLGAAGAYAAIGVHYQTHFFEGTTINGIDVSELTAGEAEELIARQAEDYRLTVTTRDGTQEVIEGSGIGYRFVSKGEVQGFLEQQNMFAWLPAYFGDGTAYSMDASVTFDEELLSQAVSKLACMDQTRTEKPQDAYVARGEDGTFAVIPEVEGNTPDPEKVYALIKERVEHGSSGANLEEGDCYLKPSVYSDDGALKAEAAVMNKYSSMTVTYQMGGGVTETLDFDTFEAWFSLDDAGQPVFDQAMVTEWVNSLADTYDTIGTWPEFVTSNGEYVYPEARTYGWQMDRGSEAEALYEILMAGEAAERSPIWQESAVTRGQNDIGDTYVEIDYTNQRMWYYKDGVLLVETPVVTGNVSAGDASPEGVFCIVYKEENAVLKGEDYETPVNYWMPFYGGVGIHDANSWRSTYGGDIYQWGGSHGCINTPTDQAAVIFANIEPGTPVVCYSSATNFGYSQLYVSDGGAASGNTGSGEDLSGTVGDDGTEEFPITIQDEYSDEQVIY